MKVKDVNLLLIFRSHGIWVFLFATLAILFSACNYASTKIGESSLLEPTRFDQSWPFDFDSTSEYAFDPERIDFTGGVCKLTGNDSIDDDDSLSGFGGGHLSGIEWDSSGDILRLSQTGSPTNRSEFDSSWTPRWSSLVAHWKLNGNSGVLASGVAIPAAIGSNGATSNANGVGLSGVSGKLAEGIQFAGTDDYIAVPDSNSLRFASGEPITISLWINPSSLAGSGTMISKGRTAGADTTNYALRYETGTPGRVAFYYRNSLNVWQVWTTTLPVLRVGQWLHLGFTYTFGTASTATLYVNGRTVAGGWTMGTGDTAPLGSTDPLWLGAVNHPGGSVVDEAFNGRIDEVAIFRAALTSGEIQTIYSRQSPQYAAVFASRVMDSFTSGMNRTHLAWVPTLPFRKELPDYAGGVVQNETSDDYHAFVGSTGNLDDDDLMDDIVGLWHLNETTATAGGANDLRDDSGGGRHAELAGGATLAHHGTLGNAASLTGANGTHLQITGAPTLTGTATFQFWINALNTQARALNYPITAGNGAAHAWGIWAGGSYTSDGQVRTLGFYFNSGGTQVSFAADDVFNDANDAGRWRHIVVVYDKNASTRTRFYKDGVLLTTKNDTATGDLPTANAVRIGARFDLGTLNYAGLIDEVAIWDRALDHKEVLQLYRRGANLLKFQARSCTTIDCSDDPNGTNWKGPDGTNQSYFSELNNNSAPLNGTGDVKASLPSMLFSTFTNPPAASRYFQYRTVFESNDTGTGCDYGSGATWCSPELRSVTIDPIHYAADSPTVVGKTGVPYSVLQSFTETLGASCAGGVGYNLGVGPSLSAATWYYWSGSAWTATDSILNATGAQSNPESVIHANAPIFGTQVGSGTVYINAFLKSTGYVGCELDRLDLSGSR